MSKPSYSRRNPHPLRLIRVARGLTQGEFARRFGKSGAWMSAIERGKIIPNPFMQRHLAAALAVAPSMVFPEEARHG